MFEETFKEIKTLSDCLSEQRLGWHAVSHGHLCWRDRFGWETLFLLLADLRRASSIQWPCWMDCRCSEDMGLLCQISFFRWGRCMCEWVGSCERASCQFTQLLPFLCDLCCVVTTFVDCVFSPKHSVFCYVKDVNVICLISHFTFSIEEENPYCWGLFVLNSLQISIRIVLCLPHPSSLRHEYLIYSKPLFLSIASLLLHHCLEIILTGTTHVNNKVLCAKWCQRKRNTLNLNLSHKN